MKPELLAPAGNLKKLKCAINFGADAVYAGGKSLSLRAFSDNFTDEVERARENGMSESRACRYFAGKVTCSIRGGDDDLFYEKVRRMLLTDGEVSDALARLTDREEYDSLTYEDKQRYMLNLSERYLKALERFRRECEFEGKAKH